PHRLDEVRPPPHRLDEVRPPPRRSPPAASPPRRSPPPAPPPRRSPPTASPPRRTGTGSARAPVEGRVGPGIPSATPVAVASLVTPAPPVGCRPPRSRTARPPRAGSGAVTPGVAAV